MLKGLLIHIGYHEDFICLVVLCYNREQSIWVQFKFTEIHQTFKGCHADSIFHADIFEYIKIHIQPTDKASWNAFDTVAFKNIEDLTLFHGIGYDYTLDLSDIYNRIKIQTVHKDHFCTVLLDQMLLLEQCVKIIQWNCDSFFAESLGNFFDQFNRKRFWKIQHGTFGTCIEDLFYIFSTTDITACDHRDTDHAVDLLDQFDGFIMFFIRVRQIKYDQFICSFFVVVFCKGNDIIWQNRTVVKPCNCLSFIYKNTWG